MSCLLQASTPVSDRGFSLPRDREQQGGRGRDGEVQQRYKELDHPAGKRRNQVSAGKRRWNDRFPPRRLSAGHHAIRPSGTDIRLPHGPSQL